MAIIQENELKKGQAKWIHRIIICILAVLIPVQLLPHFWMFFGMFKAPLEVIKFPPKLLPEKFLWENAVRIFTEYNLWMYIKNTFVLCLGVILVQVPISAMGAYALSKLRLRMGNILLLFFVGTMMISSQALLIPTYLMMVKFPLTNWNLINSFWSVILAFSAWGWIVFLFKTFFDSLPSALFEAARIDGAGNMTIFLRIVFPNSLPVFAIAVLNTFNAVYNQFVLPLAFLPRREKWPLMVMIYNATNTSIPWNLILVMLTFTSIPLIIVYALCQRYIVEGIVMTGIKG
jgi:multiple sugar transport system permease protein